MSMSGPNPNPAMNLPDDHAELLDFARYRRPDLVGHRHGSDCVVAQKPDTKQFVHLRHDQLRAEILAGPPKPKKPASSTPAPPAE